MKRTPIRRNAGIRKVRELKERMAKDGVPFQAVYLFGSVARDAAHEWSDIDVAVVCHQFRETRHEENMVIRKIRREIDVRIEPICLHPDDFQCKFFGLAQEVKQTGVEV